MTHCPACNREFPDDVEVCPTDGTAAHRVGEQPDPLVGQTIRGRYRVLRKLGEGSGGTAYLAEQVKIRRSVVLKFLREELAGDDILLERFRREARTLARLDPRYVTRVHDLDQTDAGRLFVVMEYLEGRTLRQVLEAEGQLTLSRTLALSVQIAEGLRVAHSGGVLHRGVKPQTVMVLPDETVKLTDFGVTARLQVPAVPSDASAPEL
ncbi:MAG TPA: protein kinase, partial [Candidatus Binatia bacterium]|nr:protein kinase [Candidatus Binatia bacterium]